MRPDIVRKRTGCQNCRTRRRKCDETRPECLACVRRRVTCSGYERALVFKDVSEQAAEASRRFETARWAELLQGEQRRPQRDTITSPRTPSDGPSSVANPLTPDTDNTQVDSTDNQTELSLDALDHEPAGLSHLPIPFERRQQDSVPAIEDEPAQAPCFEKSAGAVSTNSGESENASDWRTEGITNTSQGMAESGLSLHGGESSTSWFDLLDTIEDLHLWPLTSPWNVLSNGLAEKPTATVDTMADPTLDAHLSSTLEESLLRHFDMHIIQRTPIPLSFYRQFIDHDCFRYALLALAAGSRSDETRPPAEVDGSCFNGRISWLYYSTALQQLKQQLHTREHGEHDRLIAAVLLLAYYEIQNGTPYGIRNHVSGLNALAHKLDLSVPFSSELFRAWRILRYDLRFLRLPTRDTVLVPDSHDPYAIFDSYLIIRDLLSQLWLMYSRFNVEITFNPGNQVCTTEGAKQAAEWIRSLLGRRCDFEQDSNDDFHREELSPTCIIDQCNAMTLLLDKWHDGLKVSDLPRLDLRSAESIITIPSFGTVLPFRCQDGRQAYEYIIYLMCRLLCSYFRSMFDTTNPPITGGLFEVILGIIIGSDLHQPWFTVLGLDSILIATALLSEGTGVITTILEHVLPRLSHDACTVRSGGPNWTLAKGILRLLLRERIRGKAIRFMILNLEEDEEHWNVSNPAALIVFGDYNGKGYFKDVLQTAF